MMFWQKCALLLCICLHTATAHCDQWKGSRRNRFIDVKNTNCTFPDLSGKWKLERWLPNKCAADPPNYIGSVEIHRLDLKGDQIEQYKMSGTLKGENKSIEIQAYLQWLLFDRVLFGPWIQNGVTFGVLGYKLEPREQETLEGYFTIGFMFSKGKDRLTKLSPSKS
eukprot:g409.t1